MACVRHCHPCVRGMTRAVQPARPVRDAGAARSAAPQRVPFCLEADALPAAIHFAGRHPISTGPPEPTGGMPTSMADLGSGQM